MHVMTNLERYKKDLTSLIELGENMELDLTLRAMEEKGTLKKEHKEAKDKLKGEFEKGYQRWFTESCSLIRQLLPDRLVEFVALYKGEGKRKEIDSATFNIQDWLNGVRSSVNSYTGQRHFNDSAIVSMRFSTQLKILQSVQRRFESSLFDIQQLVQADLLDSELDGARELLKSGYARGAGVIAGVVLERHLSQVCANHGITLRKKNPTISDLNDLLKDTVLDVPQWRFIQRLGDLRNLCGHSKDREPSRDEVSELIEGVDKITKTLY